MKLPTINLCQCKQCKRPSSGNHNKHKRFLHRRAKVHNWNTKIRRQKPDIVRRDIETIKDREITIPVICRYTD